MTANEKRHVCMVVRPQRTTVLHKSLRHSHYQCSSQTAHIVSADFLMSHPQQPATASHATTAFSYHQELDVDEVEGQTVSYPCHSRDRRFVLKPYTSIMSDKEPTIPCSCTRSGNVQWKATWSAYLPKTASISDCRIATFNTGSMHL